MGEGLKRVKRIIKEQKMAKKEQVKISTGIHKELEKNSKFAVLFYLEEHGENSVYGIAKALGWSTGKANNVVDVLEKARSVKTRKIIENGRVKKLVRLV